MSQRSLILMLAASLAVTTLVILVVMSSGMYCVWHWGKLDALFGLTRPVLFVHVFALLALREVWKLPASIKVVKDTSKQLAHPTR